MLYHVQSCVGELVKGLGEILKPTHFMKISVKLKMVQLPSIYASLNFTISIHRYHILFKVKICILFKEQTEFLEI